MGEPADDDDAVGEFIAHDQPSKGTGRPREVPFDAGRWREYTRAGLAFCLTALLALILLLIVVWSLVFRYPSSESKELLSQILPALVGLVGAATGFYYGGKDK